MNKYDQYLADSQFFVDGLSNDQAIAYGIIAAKRFEGFYEEFSAKEKYGDIEVLRKIQRSAIEMLESGRSSSDLNELIDAIDEMIPDSEEFGDSADALDSGCIHLYLATFLASGDKINIKYIAHLSYDIWDRYAQDGIDRNLLPKDYEEAIETHSILIENLDAELKIFSDIAEAKCSNDLYACIEKCTKIRIRTSCD